MVGSGAELQQAERRLAEAFEQARAAGYEAGSEQMRELAAAERACQQARSGRHADPAEQQPP